MAFLTLLSGSLDYHVGLFVLWHSVIGWDPVNFDMALKDAQKANHFGQHVLTRSTLRAVDVADCRLVISVDDNWPDIREF